MIDMIAANLQKTFEIAKSVCYLRIRGNSLRTRNRVVSTLSDTTTSDVAMTISTPPASSEVLSGWCSSTMLNIIAVTGSNAPKIAVGVDPIEPMAIVVQVSDNTVGITASATKFSQPAL